MLGAVMKEMHGVDAAREETGADVGEPVTVTGLELNTHQQELAAGRVLLDEPLDALFRRWSGLSASTSPFQT